MAKFIVNNAAFKKAFDKPIQKILKAHVRNTIQPLIDQANKQLIRDFLSNTITKEIAAGPDAQNISYTLGGYGNLFSFLGFDKNESPIEKALEVISKNFIKLSIVETKANSWSVIINLKIPNKDDFSKYPDLDLPWAERNWLYAIEEGVAGLGRYLYNQEGFDTSRSSTGIEITGKVSGQSLPSGDVRNSQYVAHEYMSKIISVVVKALIRNIKSTI